MAQLFKHEGHGQTDYLRLSACVKMLNLQQILNERKRGQGLCSLPVRV